MLLTVSIQAGSTVEFVDLGDFFRVLAAQAPVDLRFFRNGQVMEDALGVGAGYAERFAGKTFDRFSIHSANAQDVQFVSRLGGDVRFDAPPTGNVNVTNTAGAFAQAQKTVTNASAQVLAAKPTRRYLLIQNNAMSGDVFVTLDGSAATAAHGIKIAAGGALELANFCPTGAVFAIGSIPSNAAVVAVEG